VFSKFSAGTEGGDWAVQAAGAIPDRLGFVDIVGERLTEGWNSEASQLQLGEHSACYR